MATIFQAEKREKTGKGYQTLINEALQKGFDVLQLANGDIVMTGVKTVVYQYGWDGEKGKLIRTKASSTKKGRKQDSAKDEVEDLLDEEEV